MLYEAILFDVGDTLLEAHPSQEQIYADRLRQLGFALDASAAKEIADAVSDAANAQIAREQNGAPRMPDDAFEAMLDEVALSCIAGPGRGSAYMNSLRQLPLPKQALREKDGALEVVRGLQALGYRLGIVSNHRAWLPGHLREIGLLPFFETVIISDIIGLEKPDPRIMQAALDELSLDASACLYVGDHPFDVLCAKKAGMDCAWLAAPEQKLPGSIPYSEDYRIGCLRDLLSFLQP